MFSIVNSSLLACETILNQQKQGLTFLTLSERRKAHNSLLAAVPLCCTEQVAGKVLGATSAPTPHLCSSQMPPYDVNP
jgi:hypothetical protein